MPTRRRLLATLAVAAAAAGCGSPGETGEYAPTNEPSPTDDGSTATDGGTGDGGGPGGPAAGPTATASDSEQTVTASERDQVTESDASPTESVRANVTELELTSPAFDHGASIPKRFTEDGANVSPPLEVAGVPNEVAVLALVVDDQDASDPPFTHWLVWNVPVGIATIPAGIPPAETAPALGGARQGTNGWGRLGYHGPAPPESDGPHEYRFTVYALEKGLSLPAGADRGAFDPAVNGIVTALDTLVGTYDR